MERLSNLAGSLPAADSKQSPLEIMHPIRCQRRLKPDEIDELVAMYETGLSVNELAAQVKIHRTTVMAHLRRRGVNTRRNARKLDEGQARRAADLYGSGLSLADVGIEIGVNAEVIRQALIRLGLPRRPTGRRQTRST